MKKTKYKILVTISASCLHNFSKDEKFDNSQSLKLRELIETRLLRHNFQPIQILFISNNFRYENEGNYY